MPKAQSGSGLFRVRKGITLKTMVRLTEDGEFHSDCVAWWIAILERLRTLGASGHTSEEITQGLDDFERETAAHFAKKWGVLPLQDFPISTLLAPSVGHDGRWAIIPVLPWTTRQEVVSKFRTIKAAIGSMHRDAWKNYHGAQLMRWLKIHCRHDGRPWTWAEVGAAVRGKARLSFKQEQRLMRAYQAEGHSYREAELRTRRQVTQYGRGEVAKKDVARLKADLDEWLPENAPPRWAEPLAPRLTELVIIAETADLKTLRAKIQGIEAILLQYRLSLPSSETGT